MSGPRSVTGPATTPPDQRLLRRAARQVAGWTSVAVAALVLSMAGAVLVIDEHQQHQQANRVSRSAWASADDVSDPPAQTWLIVRPTSGQRQISPGAPAAIAALDPAGLPDGIVRTVRDGRELVIYTGDRGIGRVSAAYDMSARELEERRLQVSLAMAALLGVLGAAAVGTLIGRRAVRPLGQALALQRRFVADASHELRTPLSVLLLRAQLLRRHLGQSVPAERGEEIDRLIRDARVLGDVVNDLLLSAELQHHPHTGQDVDLAALAEDVVDSMQPLAAEHGVDLSVRHPDPGSAAPVVNGAAVALRRAIAALLDNAIAHTPTGGHVQIILVVTPTQVSLTVMDDGEGLDPSETRRLVERFSRGTPTGDGRRFGLGLALVDEVARAHSGTLTVNGELGIGATFTLIIPLGLPTAGPEPTRRL